MEREEKEKGDKVLVQFWKDHHAYAHLMHKNIDVIDNKMGI